jgi:hypothetical protein
LYLCLYFIIKIKMFLREKSVAGVGNSKQGVGKLDNGNSKNICEGVGVMGNSLNNMMECNDECVVLLEKEKKYKGPA